jgi:ribosomal protein S27E
VPGPELPIDCTDCGDVLGEALGGASEATEPEESEI